MILEKIISHKKEEVANRKSNKPQIALDNLPETRPFLSRLKDKSPAIIAEIKKGSPSKGIICADFNVTKIAKSYENAGASCLSVLTDEQFFMGHDSYVLEVKNAVSLPILRKEFIIDEYQIKETRALGADAILLIVSALSDMQLNDYYYISTSLGLTVLIECHNEAEVERALALNPVLIGINNRNLNTFKTDLNTTIRLKSLIPPEILIVSESGISNKREIEFLQNHNVNAFLIGEQFMKTKEPGIALSKLL